MGSTTSFLIVIFGYLAFGISAIIWISKKKKAGEKISLKAKIIIAAVFLSSSSVLLSMIELSPALETNVSETSTYYVKTKSANVRECPSTSCKVIDSLSQNTPLTFPGDLFDKYPDWAEITFPNGKVGYISKTTLSENTVPESQLAPTDDSSSVGGVTIGPWSNIQMTLGDSYEFHFCEPPAAISGATCGGLADIATNPTGGRPPYSFIKKSGFLPPGMALELNGIFSGAPTEAGTYNFRLCAKDLYGGEGCQNLAVVVKKDKPAVQTPPDKEQVEYSATIDSISCEVGSCTKYDCAFSVTAAGTATGPVGSLFSINGAYSFRTQDIIEYTTSVGNEYSNLISDSWSGPGYGKDSNGGTQYSRRAGEPATTGWRVVTGNQRATRRGFVTAIGINIHYQSIVVFRTHEFVTCN